MNKFQKMMSQSHEDVLRRRSGIFSKRAELSFRAVVDRLEAERQRLMMKVSELSDFAPSETTSLIPGNGKGEWNSDEWAKDLQRNMFDLSQIEWQLEIARGKFAELFTDDGGEEEAGEGVSVRRPGRPKSSK